MTISPAKRQEIFDAIADRLSYVEPEDRFVVDTYGVIISAVKQSSHDAEEFTSTLAEALPPDKLLHSDIVLSEGREFYEILRQVLRYAGINPTRSRKTPLPIQVAKMLYLSPDQSVLTEEEKKDEDNDIRAAQTIYKTLTFPHAPKHHAGTDTNVATPRGHFESDNSEKRASSVKEEHSRLGPKVDTNIPSHGPSGTRTPNEQEEYNSMMAAARALRDRRGSRSGSIPHRDRDPSVTSYLNENAISGKPSSASRQKTSFTQTIMKKYDKENELFSGTDNKSWSCHLQKFKEMGKAHDVVDDDTLLGIVQWTLRAGPLMAYERYCAQPNASWTGFIDLMNNTYNSEIIHARTRNAIMSVSLRDELFQPDDGSKNTRHSGAVTRTANKILKYAKDLPKDERSDKHLLQYLRMAIQGVEFTKVAQLASLESKESTFDSLSLAIQTAAQVEDNHERTALASTTPKTREIFQTTALSDTTSEFEILFTDRRFGRIPHKRSKKCGDNKTENGAYKGKPLQCFDCKSTKHLKYHKECPAEIDRRKPGGSILDGVHKQLKEGKRPAQILACLAIALEDSTNPVREPESATEASPDPSVVDVRFNSAGIYAENNRPDSEDDLFSNNFNDRLAHSLEASLNSGPHFTGGHAF